MLAAAGLAIVWPFEVFLFAYVVLGPLHYLTEISWLGKRRFFTSSRGDVAILLVLTAAVVAAQWIGPQAKPNAAELIFIAFAAALALVLLKGLWARLAAGAVVVAAALALDPAEPFQITVLLLPTIVHVFLFTAAFILLGALRHRSWLAIGSLVVFIGCTACCFLVAPTGHYLPGAYVQDAYQPFRPLNAILIRMLHLPALGDWSRLFTSPASLAVTRFIAFAYTYHYLNWFSKTSIIGWHRVSRVALVATLAAWLAALGLYAWNFTWGFYLLASLSLAHVVLEFPLNHVTFVNIGREMARLVGRRPKQATA